MNSRDKSHIRQVIRDHIGELTLMLSEPREDTAGDDEAASLDLLANSEVDSAASSLASQNLRVLKENLAWIDGEEGGYCEDCGDEIASARLAAIPTTRVCVECAGKREK